jgi:hypothetical protein
MKNRKYMAKGGGMKGTKMRAMGGSMKGTKGMAMGGAAARERAATGMSNMPASVMKALMGEGTRAAGQTPALRGTKGMAKGGAMKGTKGMAKGGAMKGTKGKAKGGAMKGTKGMAVGGAAKSVRKPKRSRGMKTPEERKKIFTPGLSALKKKGKRKPSNAAGALGRLLGPKAAQTAKQRAKNLKPRKNLKKP